MQMQNGNLVVIFNFRNRFFLFAKTKKELSIVLVSYEFVELRLFCHCGVI